MFEKGFERVWKTPDEEISQLLAKNEPTEHDKERIKELQRRQRETQNLQEMDEKQQPKDEDPHLRKPGQEGYF